MGFVNWIRNFFSESTSTIALTDKITSGTNIIPLVYEDFAICSAMNLIAGAISKCEFKTFQNKKEVQGDEYYAWNIEPNKNQNSSQYIQEFVTKLLYYNECLVIEVNGQFIIADDYDHKEYAVMEDIFSNVTRGDFTFDRSFRMSEVLFFKLNNVDIRNLLSNLYKGYSDLITKSISKYAKAGGRKGILTVKTPKFGDTKWEEQYKTLINDRFKTYFNADNAVLPLFDGYEYNEPTGEQGKKAANEVGDISTIMSEAFDRVAQAFKIPPALLKGNIADVEKLTQNFLTFCIDPITAMISEEITRKRYGLTEFKKGNYIEIDTTCIMHIYIFSIAQAVDKLIACSIYNVDEIRKKVGDSELNTEWSKAYRSTKNYEDVKNVDQNGDEGGENV